MLDDLIEFILELFIEGFLELFPRFPRPVRIFLTCTILIILFGGSGLLIGFGIANKTTWMLILGAVLLIGTVIWFTYLIHKYRWEQRLLGEC